MVIFWTVKVNMYLSGAGQGLVSYSMGTCNVLWELCTLHVPMFLICLCDLDNTRRGHWRPRHGDWQLHRPWVPYWLRVQGKTACKEKNAPYFIKLKKIYLYMSFCTLSSSPKIQRRSHLCFLYYWDYSWVRQVSCLLKEQSVFSEGFC